MPTTETTHPPMQVTGPRLSLTANRKSYLLSRMVNMCGSKWTYLFLFAVYLVELLGGGLDCSRTNKLIDHTKYTLKSRNILPIKQTRDQSERGSKLSTPKKVSFAGLRESECAAVYSKLNSRERRGGGGGYCGETNQQFVTKFTGNLLVAVVVAMVQWRANGWMDGKHRMFATES